MRSIKSFMFIGLLSTLALTMMCGVMLASSTVLADDDAVVDEVSVTVPVACSMTGTGMNTHNAEIYNGLYVPNIGTTTIQAFCNDANGFAIYATGYTGDEVGGTNSNKLVGTSTSGNAVIETGLATAPGNPDVSNWAMKIATVQDSGDTTGDKAFVIDSAPNTAGGADASFASYHVVPNEYTKVAHKNAGTDMTAGTGGVKLTTTYAAYISQTQMADTYSGKVKYTLVHPSMAVAGRLNVTYNGNGLTFAGDKATNLVVYDATEATTTGAVTKKSYVNGYKEDGSFSGYGTPAGNNVVTIDGASTIHIAVTYGAPQTSGGPPSDLYIWAGNHPDYTNTNSSTALSSCGSTSAVNGAYSSTGAGGTQVTMECDITGDSVTFYDYSANTNNAASMGYYAVVTGEGDVTTYSKTTVSGTYATPADTPGSYTFFGWSTDPNATEPMYTNEADIIANAPYTNADITLNLYAVWGRTFGGAFARAGKTKYNGYYKMSDTTSAVCSDVYVGATEQVIDTRDGSIYTIGKLKDGKCWMLDNLAIDLTKALDSYSGADKITLDATNTNATNTSLGYLKGTTTRDPSTDASGKYATAAVANWTTSYSYSAPLVNMNSKATVPQGSDPMASTVSAGGWKIGGYYNYCAASAGSYCYGNGTSYGTSVGNATEDICPAGWRMPGGSTTITLGDNPPTGEYQNLYNQYKDYTNFRTALHLPLSGSFFNGSPNDQGSVGRWWSSTRNGNYTMYYLNADTGDILPASSYNRYRGYSIRCVLGP